MSPGGPGGQKCPGRALDLTGMPGYLRPLCHHSSCPHAQTSARVSLTLEDVTRGTSSRKSSLAALLPVLEWVRGPPLYHCPHWAKL